MYDPGIKDAVEFMQANGFRTTDSGDGVSKHDMECALDYPHVFAIARKVQAFAEADRLYRALKTGGFPVADPAGVSLHYAPADGICLLIYAGPPGTTLTRKE